MRVIGAAVATMALALPASLQAHAFWLQPDDYHVEKNESITFNFRVGDGAEAEDWDLYWDRVVSLRSYQADGVVDRQAEIVATTDTERGGASFSFVGDGTHIVAFESQTSFSDLKPDRFDAYVREEGLTAIAEVRRANGGSVGNGTELYSRRSKALIQVGDDLTDNVTIPIGQTLEIVPEINPYTLSGEAQMPLRVMYRGKPLGGATVHFVDLDRGGEAIKRQTDSDGRVAFEIADKGRWLFDVVWATPSPQNDRADFSTIFSSLTFGRK